MEITLDDVIPYIAVWTCLAFFLLFALYYRVWKLYKTKPKTSEDKKEQERLYHNYAVLLFSGSLVYAAVLCVLFYIGAPIKQTRALLLLLLFFSVNFIIFIKQFRKS